MPSPSERLFPSTEADRAAAEIYHRYSSRLRGLVHSRMGAKLQRRIDADDVTQSTFRSYFLGARQGRYQVAQSAELWQLLASMAINKTRKQLERHRAARRDVFREQQAPSAVLNSPGRNITALDNLLAQEHFHAILTQLTAVQRAVLEHAAEGWSTSRIAKALGKSERTVRRMLMHLRERLQADTDTTSHTNDNSTALTPLAYGDYVLEKLIGSGGMGKVFRARIKQSGELVALKALHKSRQTDPRAVQRFVQEAQILERLSHPNIVSVRGLGRFPSGGHFMVQDYVESGDLESRLTHGALPSAIALKLFRQIVEATAHAHRHGIVHCDLKPANVLVTPANRAVVTDFGFACLMNPSANPPPSIGGTIGFVAPELLQPGAAATPAADVYSLGILLRCILADSSALQHVIRRCVANDPTQRFADASRLLCALDTEPQGQ